MVEQLAQLKSQLEQLRNQYEAITGSYGIGGWARRKRWARKP